MINILLVDDHAFLRRGLKHVLEEEFASAKVVEADNGQAAVGVVRQQSFDLMILDVNLPDKNGIEVLQEVKILRPSLRVIMLTLYPEEQYAIRALKAGALGYLTKDSEPEELLAAVKKVMNGGTYVSSSFGEQLASQLISDNKGPAYQTLSNRELAVLRLLGQGKSITQISEVLSLSPKTIGTYLTRIKEKLRLDTTAALIRYALDHHLVD